MVLHLLLLLWGQHELWSDILVKVLAAQRLEFHGTFLEGQLLLVSILGNLAGHVVSDDRVQAGDKHETKYHVSSLFEDSGAKSGLEKHTFRSTTCRFSPHRPGGRRQDVPQIRSLNHSRFGYCVADF